MHDAMHQQTACGLQFLQFLLTFAAGVMHRDIKPENFLLTDKTEAAVIKAADFGLCTYFKPGQRFRHIVGSAYYVAPEVLQKNYSHEADMWSLGVVLYILLCGLPPFWGDTGAK